MGRFVYPICVLNKVPYGICKFSVPMKYWLLKKTATHYVPSSDIEGTSVNLVNSGEYAPIKFDIMGNTIQDGTPSPTNPVPINSVGDNVNIFDKDGTLTSNRRVNTGSGGTYSSTGYSVSDYIEIKANTNFTLTTGITSYFCFYDSEKTYISGTSWTNKTSKTTPANAKYIRFDFETDNISNVKLEQGSLASSYSPYNMGAISIEKCNKNFCGEIETGYFDTTTGNKTSGNFYRSKDFISVAPNTTYKFSINGTGKAINVLQYSNKSTYLFYNNIGANETFTTGSTTHFINIFRGQGDGNEKWQIEKGSTPTTYTPHQGQTYSIYTQAPMRAIGEVRDDFIKQNGVWYERHKIGRVVLDGTEDEYTAMPVVDDNYMFYATHVLIPIENYSEDYLTNYFTTNTARSGSSTIGSYIYNQTLRMRVPSTVATTKEEFKTWLSTHNTEVIYVLAEPTLTECTEKQVEQLEAITKDRLYLGGTSFYSNDEIPPYLLIKYYTAETEAEESEEEDNEGN